MTQVIHPSMRLASQHSQDGVRYRPAVDAEEESPNGEWAVRSVAVRPGGSHIAVTFCPAGGKGVPFESFYRTVVWLIRDPSKQTGTDDWAERILVDRTESSIFRCPVPDSYITEGRGSVVSFAENGTLTTPGGIYNIFTQEKLYSPPQIFHPTTRVTSTSFNGHRIARIRDLTELEVLSLDGQLIGTFSFPGSEVLQVCTMGYTGQKIVMTYTDVTAKRDLRRIQCVHVASGNIVRLQSRGVSRLNFSRFTASEERLVGRVSCNPDHSGSEIAVWDVASGHVAYIFKDPDPRLSFCLSMDDTNVLIISPTGRLIHRNIGQQWSPDEEAKFFSQYANDSGSDAGKSLWQVIGSFGICRLSYARRSQTSEVVSGDASNRGKPAGLNRLMSKMSQVLHAKQLSSSPDKINLELLTWCFNTNDTVRNLIELGGSTEAGLAISSEGNMIAAMGKYVHASDDGLRQISPSKQEGYPQRVYFSPDGSYILTVEEKNEARLIQAHRTNDDFSTLESCGSHRLNGYIMDLNIIFHDTAPVFAVTYTKMSPYSGSMGGESLIAVISKEKLQIHHISGTFHPSCGFSHCGKYFFGTVTMEEAEDFEVYDEPETEASNSLRGDAGMDEPNSDEPTSGNLHIDSHSIDGRRLDELSPGQAGSIGSNGSKSPEGPKSPKIDAAFRETDDDPSHDPSFRCSSPSVELDVASEVGTKKYQWPKLYKLPSELRHPVPEDQQEAVKFKLGSYYMRAPHICRLRLSENMGILYLDRMQSDDAGKIGSPDSYRSRVLCVVPDAFLDLSTTEIVLVWPQRSSRSATSKFQPSAKDKTVKIVLFPSGHSNVPILINTGLQGPTLTQFLNNERLHDIIFPR